MIEDILNRMEQEDTDQREAGVSRAKRWRSIPRETGQFLFQITMIHRPQLIVEIGMSHGYSTIWLGLAANHLGATVMSYEVEKWKYEQAVQNITAAGLDETIRPQLVDPSFAQYPPAIDLAFIDAEKSDYITHFTNIEQNLDKNAIVIADNTVSHEDELQDYLDHVRMHPSFFSIPIPVGKGLELTRRVLRQEDTLIPSLR